MTEENPEEGAKPGSVHEDIEPGTDATPQDENAAPPPEKKVQLNDDPQVYEMDPNSTEVKALEKSPPQAKPGAGPGPCPPPIDQQHLDQIIADTMDIIDHSQKQCNDQKLATQKMAFMLTCIQDSLHLYGCHAERLNAFLVNDEDLQTKWFCQIKNGMKGFGDYTLVLKDSPEEVMVDGIPTPVPENELKKLAEQAVNNFYAGGVAVQAHRTICKGVNDKIDDRMYFLDAHLEPFDSWFVLLNKAADNQDVIRDMLFKVAANVSFLKTGETTDTLVLDLSKELQALAVKK